MCRFAGICQNRAIGCNYVHTTYVGKREEQGDARSKTKGDLMKGERLGDGRVEAGERHVHSPKKVAGALLVAGCSDHLGI